MKRIIASCIRLVVCLLTPLIWYAVSFEASAIEIKNDRDYTDHTLPVWPNPNDKQINDDLKSNLLLHVFFNNTGSSFNWHICSSRIIHKELQFLDGQLFKIPQRIFQVIIMLYLPPDTLELNKVLGNKYKWTVNKDSVLSNICF